MAWKSNKKTFLGQWLVNGLIEWRKAFNHRILRAPTDEMQLSRGNFEK